MDVTKHNREAWNEEVQRGNIWTRAVTADVIYRAKQGHWQLLLTPTRAVPVAWYPPLRNCRVLCLASGGGQQGPVLAAAGALVTVFDNSPSQLAQDTLVAEQNGLELATVQGDMRVLSNFDDASFDLVFHPVSNCFVPNVEPVWREAYRVLRPGGVLLAGFCNPVLFLFDHQRSDAEGRLNVRYRVPYSDLEQLPKDQLQKRLDDKETLEFGHTLEQQMGGQLKAGFVMTDMYEDSCGGEDALDAFHPSFIATRAEKLQRGADGQ